MDDSQRPAVGTERHDVTDVQPRVVVATGALTHVQSLQDREKQTLLSTQMMSSMLDEGVAFLNEVWPGESRMPSYVKHTFMGQYNKRLTYIIKQ